MDPVHDTAEQLPVTTSCRLGLTNTFSCLPTKHALEEELTVCVAAQSLSTS